MCLPPQMFCLWCALSISLIFSGDCAVYGRNKAGHVPTGLSELEPKASKNEIHSPWLYGLHNGSVWWMDVRSRLATNMKSLRKERGWSQETLAGEAGLDRTYISGIERQLKNPTIVVVERIAKALGCKLGELLD